MRLMEFNKFNKLNIELLNDGDELYLTEFYFIENWSNGKDKIFSILPTKIKVHKKVQRNGYTVISLIGKYDKKSFYAKCKYDDTSAETYGKDKDELEDADFFLAKKEAEEHYEKLVEDYINHYRNVIKLLEKYKSPK